MNLDQYAQRLATLPALEEESYDEGTEPWEDEDLLDWEYDPSVKEQRA